MLTSKLIIPLNVVGMEYVQQDLLSTRAVSRARHTDLTQREPLVADRGGPLVGGCQVIIKKAWLWTIGVVVLGECT